MVPRHSCTSSRLAFRLIFRPQVCLHALLLLCLLPSHFDISRKQGNDWSRSVQPGRIGYSFFSAWAKMALAARVMGQGTTIRITKLPAYLTSVAAGAAAGRKDAFLPQHIIHAARRLLGSCSCGNPRSLLNSPLLTFQTTNLTGNLALDAASSIHLWHRCFRTIIHGRLPPIRWIWGLSESIAMVIYCLRARRMANNGADAFIFFSWPCSPIMTVSP